MRKISWLGWTMVAALTLLPALLTAGALLAAAPARAGEQSAQQLQSAAKSCDAAFLGMVPSAAAGSSPADPAVLGSALAAAAGCNFANSLKPEEIVRALEGLLQARPALESMIGRGLPVQAIIDLDLILFEIEDAAINDAHEKIVKCSDQSAWVDTDKKTAYKCALPHRDFQMKLAQAICDQVKSDYRRIGEVPDKSYRLKFWESHRKIAKTQVMEEIAEAYQLYQDADQAMKKEGDPEVAGKIEDVMIRLSGSGKPRGAPINVSQR